MNVLGKVVDNFDPDYEGKIKCRVFVNQEEKDTSGNYIIPDDNLPWCIRTVGTNPTSFSIPKVGDVVILNKINDYTYFYNGNLKVDKDVIDNLLTDKNYIDANVLLYRKLDNGMTVGIYYTDETGLVIESSDSDNKKITLDNDGNITLLSGESSITIKENQISIKSDKIAINSDNIVINDGSERLISFNTLKTAFNNHTHSTSSGPTGIPLTPLSPNGYTKKIKI